MNTKTDISGLWKGEYIDDTNRNYDRIYSSYFRVNSDKSGYFNGYYKEFVNQDDDDDTSDNYRGFSGSLVDFVSYEVTGDIITLKDSVLNTTTNKKEVKNVANIRYKKNQIGGYNICTPGNVEQVYTQVTSMPSDLGTSMGSKIWWDGTDKALEENVLLLSGSKAIYLKKTNDRYRTDDFSFNSTDTIIGSYKMKDYNIDIDLSYVQNGKKNYKFSDILIDRIGSRTFLGAYDTKSYKLYTSTNDRSSSLSGTWTLATEKTDLDPVKEIYDNIVVDNSNKSESPNLYSMIDFSNNNLLYLRKNIDDTDYQTCISIVTNGKLFFFKKYQKNSTTVISKQYEWEVRNNMLWLKYRYYPSGYSATSKNYTEHVVVYKKNNSN